MKRDNVVSLSVHKNTRDRRRAKQARKDMISAAKDCAQLEGVTGYAIVTWNADGTEGNAIYNSGNMAPRYVPEYARSLLDSAMKKSSGEY